MKYKDVNFYIEFVDIETIKVIIIGTARIKEINELAKFYAEEMDFRNVHVYAEDVCKTRQYEFSYNRDMGFYQILKCDTHF